MIKANAYGHGMFEVAHALESHRPGKGTAFGVSCVNEAVQLRDAGIASPILILQGTNCVAEVTEAAAKDFWLMLHNQQQLEQVLHADTSVPLRVWIKIDTGMHRLGFNIADLDTAVPALLASANVDPAMVMCTHLACADDLESPLTGQQVSRLKKCAAQYQLPMSIANSAAIMTWPESHTEWNRPGYMLYGNCPMGSMGDSVGLVPAMTMTSSLMSVREIAAGEGVGYGSVWVASKRSKIGTISIGYEDGYPRHAVNGTPVLVNGQRVPLAGRVSMGMLSVDLSSLDNVEPGDPVELWGENLSVNEVASYAGTIGYEILSGLTGRIPISYLS